MKTLLVFLAFFQINLVYSSNSSDACKEETKEWSTNPEEARYFSYRCTDPLVEEIYLKIKDTILAKCFKSLEDSPIGKFRFDQCLFRPKVRRFSDQVSLCISENMVFYGKNYFIIDQTVRPKRFKNLRIRKAIKFEDSYEDLINPFRDVVTDCLADIENKKNSEQSSSDFSFISEFNIHTDAKDPFEKLFIGGISGVYFDNEKNAYMAVSDDLENWGGPRLYTFSLDLKKKGLGVEIKKTDLIANDFGSGLGSKVDIEAIVKLGPGKHLYSFETGMKDLGSALFLSEKGEEPSPLPFDPNFIGEYGFLRQKSGITPNKGIEGMSLSPSGEFLFTVPEGPLVQDGDPLSKSQKLRFMLYQRYQNDIFSQINHFIYPIDHYPENGVSDLLAIDDKNFLSMERSYKKEEGNKVKLWLVSLGKGETDIKDVVGSIKHKTTGHLKKLEILDFETMAPLFAAGQRKLDNFEAMTFGPKLKNGHNTLVVFSDNNFKWNQVNKILALEITNPTLNKLIDRGRGSKRPLTPAPKDEIPTQRVLTATQKQFKLKWSELVRALGPGIRTCNKIIGDQIDKLEKSQRQEILSILCTDQGEETSQIYQCMNIFSNLVQTPKNDYQRYHLSAVFCQKKPALSFSRFEYREALRKLLASQKSIYTPAEKELEALVAATSNANFLHLHYLTLIHHALDWKNKKRRPTLSEFFTILDKNARNHSSRSKLTPFQINNLTERYFEIMDEVIEQ